jgi:hypothetical protein
LGVELNLEVLEAEPQVALFCERPAILFEVAPERATALFQAARERSLAAWPVGAVATHGRMRVRLGAEGVVEWSRDELESAARASLPELWNEEES